MRSLYSRCVRSLMLPWVSRVSPSEFWNVYKAFGRSTPSTAYVLSEDEFLARLQALLQHAYRNVEMYRQMMDRRGVPPDRINSLEDFRQLEPVYKSDIEANFPDRVASMHHVFKPWRYVSTSGTIERMTVMHDFRKRDFMRASQLFALKAATGYEAGFRYMELPPDICINVCGTSENVEPRLAAFVWDNLRKRRLNEPQVLSDLRGLIERQVVYRWTQLPSFGTEGFVQKDETLDGYLSKIDAYHPYVLKGLPAYLYLLAQRILESRRVPPKVDGCLMPMGGSLSKVMRRVIEEAFQRPVHEDYGSAELGTLATECGHQKGLHPLAGLFHIEVVRAGRPVGDGEIGRVLVTDLYNYAMPLIRYDIGDVALLRRGLCECGLPGDRLEIQGRVQDCMQRPDGTIVTPDQVTDFMLGENDIFGFQLVLRDGRPPSLDVVAREGATVNVNEMAKKLVDFLQWEETIVGRLVSTILPEAGGKYRFVKNLTSSAKEIL